MKLHGESADSKDFNGWLEENRELIANFLHDWLLNIDETASFWRADGANTFVSLDETKPKDFKSEKSRLSLLLSCVADGTKLPLYAIGGAANPLYAIGGTANPLYMLLAVEQNPQFGIFVLKGLDDN